jgi:lysophospholipase L1-like esterase
LLFALSGAIALVMGLAAAYIHLRSLDPRDIYAGFEHHATIVYLLLWCAIAALGAAVALWRRLAFLSFCILLLIGAEGMTQAYYFVRNGKIYRPTSAELLTRFEPHPLLVGIPRPGQFGDISHDAEHHRTTINLDKIADPKLIYLFGGSTTYDVGVDDRHTWASDLSSLLGSDYAVVNWGVPGYNTVEHLIQSLFAFREKQPVCALYYIGINDLASSHQETLKEDYSDRHLPRQAVVLAVGHRPGFLERNMLLVALLRSVFAPAAETSQLIPIGKVSGVKDERLTKIYTENVRLILLIARSFGVKPIFIPQIINKAQLTSDKPFRWGPLIPEKDAMALMAAMNEDLRRVAEENGAAFLAAPLAVDWQDSDFVDKVHFSAKGAEKFARAISGDVLRECR